LYVIFLFINDRVVWIITEDVNMSWKIHPNNIFCEIINEARFIGGIFFCHSLIHRPITENARETNKPLSPDSLRFSGIYVQ
jgi:hypothetical protein